MKEYFECKRCYSRLSKRKIVKHHAQVHSDTSYEVYLDTYFNLNRPLYKCDSCSVKLKIQRLIKHCQRAHPNKDNTFKKYTLPLLRHIENKDKTRTQRTNKSTIIVLSSDSESGRVTSSTRNKPSYVDKASQCESAPDGNVIEHRHQIFDEKNIHCIDQDSINRVCQYSGYKTFKNDTKEVATQVSIEPSKHPVYYGSIRYKQPCIEYDEDNLPELVFYL